MTKVEEATELLYQAASNLRLESMQPAEKFQRFIVARDAYAATIRAEQQRAIKIERNENSLLRGQVKRLKAERLIS